MFSTFYTTYWVSHFCPGVALWASQRFSVTSCSFRELQDTILHTSLGQCMTTVRPSHKPDSHSAVIFPSDNMNRGLGLFLATMCSPWFWGYLSDYKAKEKKETFVRFLFCLFVYYPSSCFQIYFLILYIYI